MTERNATATDLALIAAKYGISDDVARRSLLGTGTTNPQPERTVMAESKPRPHNRIRQSKKPLLNKLETEWFEMLKTDYPPGCVILPQSVRFRLGNGIWYKPDFLVFGNASVYAYEVKGPHAFRGGYENLKVAASLYQRIKWILVWFDSRGWGQQEVLP